MLLKKLLHRGDSSDDLPTKKWAALPAPTSNDWDHRLADDEREAPRVEARLVASVEIADGAHVGFTENISEGGVFIATQAPQKIGAGVSLLIALPDLALVRAEGTVRWIRRASDAEGRAAGMGICFESLSALDAVRIHEFVAARQSKHIDDDGARRRSA